MRFNGVQWQAILPGPNSNHHIASVELERTVDLPFKVPSLRNLFDKFGFDLAHTNSQAGFGFFHDGGVDTLVRFVQDGFSFTNDQTTADLVAFLFSFTGSDLIPGSLSDGTRSPGVTSLDTPAAVGQQVTLNSSNRVALLDSMLTLANSSSSRVDLIVKGVKDGLARGWVFDRTTGNFKSDRLAEVYSPDALRALASVGSEQTYTVVPRGLGVRLGIDEDGDGYLDRDELDFASDPRNPASIPTNPPPLLGLVNSGAGGITVSWSAVAGRTYQLQFKTALTDLAWQNARSVTATNASGVVSDPVPANGTRFYRLLSFP
jgi:hypothetical protein